jgi:hypothetical protein
LCTRFCLWKKQLPRFPRPACRYGSSARESLQQVCAAPLQAGPELRLVFSLNFYKLLARIRNLPAGAEAGLGHFLSRRVVPEREALAALRRPPAPARLLVLSLGSQKRRRQAMQAPVRNSNSGRFKRLRFPDGHNEHTGGGEGVQPVLRQRGGAGRSLVLEWRLPLALVIPISETVRKTAALAIQFLTLTRGLESVQNQNL